MAATGRVTRNSAGREDGVPVVESSSRIVRIRYGNDPDGGSGASDRKRGRQNQIPLRTNGPPRRSEWVETKQRREEPGAVEIAEVHKEMMEVGDRDGTNSKVPQSRRHRKIMQLRTKVAAHSRNTQPGFSLGARTGRLEKSHIEEDAYVDVYCMPSHRCTHCRWRMEDGGVELLS